MLHETNIDCLTETVLCATRIVSSNLPYSNVWVNELRVAQR